MEQWKRLLLSKFDQVDGCWIWKDTAKRNGYGMIAFLAHRLVYEVMKGTIPDKLHLDHLCKNRMCVNPNHLEPVTNATNNLRGDSLPAREARQTYCKYGHPFDLLNTYYFPSGKRSCRKCNNRRAKETHARRLARNPDYIRALARANSARYRQRLKYQHEATSEYN